MEGGATYVNPDLQDMGEDDFDEPEAPQRRATVYVVSKRGIMGPPPRIAATGGGDAPFPAPSTRSRTPPQTASRARPAAQIDVGAGMYARCHENLSWADCALMAVCDEVCLDAVGSPEDTHAVILCGTDKGRSPKGDSHTVLLPLGLPSVARVRAIDPLGDTFGADDDYLQRHYPPGGPSQVTAGVRLDLLTAALGRARELLDGARRGKAHAPLHKRVVVWTRDANPMGAILSPATHGERYDKTIRGMRSLVGAMAQAGVELGVHLLHADGDGADVGAWEALLPGPGDGPASDGGPTVGLVGQAELAALITGNGIRGDSADGAALELRPRQRSFATLQVAVGPAGGMSFTARAYHPVTAARVPAAARVDARGRLVEARSTYVSRGGVKFDAAADVPRAAFRFGQGPAVSVPRGALARARRGAGDLGAPGVRVTGFVPRVRALAAAGTTGKWFFLAPDRRPGADPSGCRDFAALHAAMSRRGVAGVGLRAPAGDPVVLVPVLGTELRLPLGTALAGDGFAALAVPSAAQVRDLAGALRAAQASVAGDLQVDEGAVSAARGLVAAARLEDGWTGAERVHQPALQRHLQIVIRQATGRLRDFVPRDGGEDDETVGRWWADPGATGDGGPVREAAERWAAACGGGRAGAGPAAGAKRKPAADAAPPAVIPNGRLLEMLSGGTLQSLTVPELKAGLSANGLKTGGKKQDLLTRLELFLRG